MATDRKDAPVAAKGYIPIHPLMVRVTHWINALAMAIMIFSGWRIYNASPLFNFKFPSELTLGGWLAGALQWHFAAMWLFALNGLVYFSYGIFSGHFKTTFLPVTPASVWNEFKKALHGKLAHETGIYNSVQRAAYVGVIGVLAVILLSGLSVWKPVQFQALAALMGGYEGARFIHFAAMSLVCLFVVVHVVMVALVPRTFFPMLTSRAKKASPAHGA